MIDAPSDGEFVLTRFNRLVQELLRGDMKRNCFRPWEIEILLDIESCSLKKANRREVLRRYQRAVQREMENGGGKPMKLSEYLERCRLRARRRVVAACGAPGAEDARGA